MADEELEISEAAAGDRVVLNGIDGSTGNYIPPALSVEAIAQIAMHKEPDKKHLKELMERHERSQTKVLGTVEGIDPKDLAQTGWGVIFAQGVDPAIKEALKELLDHRQEQAAKNKEQYFRVFDGKKGFQPKDKKGSFLARNGAGPGPADPDKVPYYLLIVGDPETIPFSFQYHLDVSYAVGRIHFDTLDEYEQYARNVVAVETGERILPRRATFFGVRNSGDLATQLSADHLVRPLAERLSANQDKWLGGEEGWEVDSILAKKATKANLSGVFGGEDTPQFLFTASHGISFPNGDERQLPHQGGLICQEWPGKRHKGEIPESFYFSADDIGKDANLRGMISFHFACYGAGTPRLDDFAHQAYSQGVPIAPHAFIARLPQRLLTHPAGGALAVVGHVERAWTYSFMWERAGQQIQTFESTLKRLMKGFPVGAALEYFNERYAEMSADLNVELDEIRSGKAPDELALADMWTANNDARSYVIIGDPAVRLA